MAGELLKLFEEELDNPTRESLEKTGLTLASDFIVDSMLLDYITEQFNSLNYLFYIIKKQQFKAVGYEHDVTDYTSSNSLGPSALNSNDEKTDISFMV